MVFLGLEQPVAYGRQLVFDPTTALMVLNANKDYINAVYNDYQLARLDMKDFLKEYGDFLSPILADMDWYEKNISGDIRNFVNSMYELGIDPLRSQEGRALVARKLASLPVQLMSLKRQAAEAAKEYVKNRDAMIKAGMWNEDYERHMLGGLTLEEWDNSLGAWKATSASPYMDYAQKYGHLFKDMPLEYDEEESAKHPGYLVKTRSKDRMRDILSASRPEIVNDSQYKYDLQRLKDSGLSDKEAAAAIENEIISRNYKGGYEMETDQYALDNHRTANDIKKDAAKAAIDFEYDKKRLTDPVFMEAASKSGKGGGKSSEAPNIFREAEALIPKHDIVRETGKAGVHVLYQPGLLYYQHIDPVVQADLLIVKNKNTGETKQLYRFYAWDMKLPGSVYEIDGTGTVHETYLNDNTASTYTFYPEGNMRSKYENGRYRYFIAGTMKSNDGRDVKTEDGKQRVWIEVKERGFNYGLTLRKK